MRTHVPTHTVCVHPSSMPGKNLGLILSTWKDSFLAQIFFCKESQSNETVYPPLNLTTTLWGRLGWERVWVVSSCPLHFMAEQGSELSWAPHTAVTGLEMSALWNSCFDICLKRNVFAACEERGLECLQPFSINKAGWFGTIIFRVYCLCIWRFYS